MTALLQDALLEPDTRPLVVADCEELLKQEVSGLSGVSGTAVKLAYKTVVKFSPDHIKYMIDTLLPRLTDELQPYWAGFQSSGTAQFGAYLAERGDEVSEALLSVTDERGRKSDRPMITKAYGAVRDKAAKHVTAALPRVGDLVQKYGND
jgi:hypothetical protein